MIQARFDCFTRTRGPNRDVAHEAADFVAHFGGKRRAMHVVGDVVGHVDVTAVIDESPARAVDDRAAADRGRISVVDEAVAVEMNRIAAARIGARAGLSIANWRPRPNH